MSTPLFQEALIEAQKLREAATAEAQSAVLKAVSPLIKKMIDQEISGVILEQQEEPGSVTVDPTQTPATGSADMPPPAPPAPSPDAGSVAPLDATPTPAPSTTGTTPAVTAASPPIVAPAVTQVLGKIETGPAGEQQIVIPVDSLFQPTPPASDATAAPPAEPVAADMPPAELPAPTEPAPAPAGLAEIFSAVDKFLGEQQPAPATQQPPTAPAVDPLAPAGQSPAPAPTAAVAPPAAPAVAAPTAPTAPTAPAAPAAPPPVQPVPTAAAAPAPQPAQAQPAPVAEYSEFKEELSSLEEAVTSMFKADPSRVTDMKHKLLEKLLTLQENLGKLKDSEVISPRLHKLNEARLGLAYENLQIASSYSRNPLSAKGKDMKTKTGTLKDFAKALFEGAEGFEKEVGHVKLPAEPSVTGDHAQKVSGNPDGVSAEAEGVDFDHKADPGPQDKALLEQLEEEISALMAEMSGEDDVELSETSCDEGDDDVVLEVDEAELVAEAQKAKKRLKALREQEESLGALGGDEGAEGDELDSLGAGGDESLSLTLDLDGVSGEDVENVNVALDGEDLEVEMGEEEAGEGMEDMGDDMSGMSLAEVRKLVREQLEEMGMVDEKEEEVHEADMVSENKMLRSQLDETRLLTARSIYLNKLFVRDDLSGAQKRKIVKYLDSARTLAEAKNVYNSIVKVLDRAGKAGAKQDKGALQEGKQVLAPNAAPAVPSFDTSRWQVLAGMKKTAK